MAKIVMLLQEYYPQDVRVRKEVAALIECNHSMIIYCLTKPGQKNYEEVEGVKIYRANLSKERGGKLRYIYEYLYFFIASMFFLKKQKKQTAIDVLYVHTLPDFLVFAGYSLKKGGTKIVLDLHEILPEFFMSKYNLHESNPIIKVLKWIERKSIQYADRVVTVNDSIKEIFDSRAKSKNEITVVMNTCNNETHPQIEKANEEKFIAIYHGTLTKTYNLKFAINAIAEIKDQLNDFHFHIYGSGTEEGELRNLVKQKKLEDWIIIHGYVHHTLIPGILAKAKLGILPMERDIMLDLSFSNKLAEYVHYKIPVLSSDLSAVKHYFPDDCISYYESGNKQDFQKVLLAINKDYAKAFANAERAAFVYSSISWDVMKQRLQKLIKELN